MTTERVPVNSSTLVFLVRSAHAQKKVTGAARGLVEKEEKCEYEAFVTDPRSPAGDQRNSQQSRKEEKSGNKALRATYGRASLNRESSWGRRKKRALGFCYKSRPAFRVRKAPEIEVSRRLDWRKHAFGCWCNACFSGPILPKQRKQPSCRDFRVAGN